ncbi:hypothetical protein, partial [Streptomyces sp. NPDC059003]|uniref:hypothetical protein n=1 Tax=Streptomyces sp. NPDC059003 TaxID=3346691 RepID=UPI0036A8D5CD
PILSRPADIRPYRRATPKTVAVLGLLGTDPDGDSMSALPRYHGNHHSAVGRDVLALMEGDTRLGEIALARIGQLTRGEIFGHPLLEARAGLADLSDCRVVWFDTQEHDPGWRNIVTGSGVHLPARDPAPPDAPRPRFCILYRLQDPVPGSDGKEDPRICLQVLAVAARTEVYRTGGRRLQRPAVVTHQPSRAARPSLRLVRQNQAQQETHLQDSGLPPFPHR